MSLIDEIKKLIPKEIIAGCDVEETAKMMDLDLAYKLLVVQRYCSVCSPEDEFTLFSNPPPVTSNIKKRPDGQYQIDWVSEEGPDFEIVSADEVKIMRARFLLLKGFYSQNFNKLTLPKQNEVAVQYDIHWVPPEGMILK